MNEQLIGGRQQMQTNLRFPRGSEWRRWDLQIHTPYSELNNGFGTDFREYARRLLVAAVEKKIAVVGVTDYFGIEGYTALRALVRDRNGLESLIGDPQVAATASDLLFLPNIEFRTSVIIRNPKSGDSRVNFHVIFADSVDPHQIEENFLREIKFAVDGNPFGQDEKWALTRSNLADLGKKLKEHHLEFHKHSDLFVGMMNAVVDHHQVTEILDSKPSLFKDRFVLCLPCDEDLSKCSWDGQGHLARKVFIQKSHFLFSSNPGTRDFALGRKHATVESFQNEFKTLKPCVHGSDAHDFDSLFEPGEGRFTWIKADPTFVGLRQVLNEAEDRVFIGLHPPALEHGTERSTRIVDTINISKKSGSILMESWFNVTLPLNQELIAIIGNKGSGKSALADVLGLLGNTPRFANFSFLRDDRFRDPRNNKSKHFEASLKWRDGNEEPNVSLDANPSPGSIEKIKYIPQNYLEEICNEVGLGRGSRFYAELQDVIFSHVPESDRLGFGTLDDLLRHRTEEVNDSVKVLQSELHGLNAAIVNCEEQLLPQHEKLIAAQLLEKQREIDALDARKPKELKKPEDDSSAVEQTKAAAQQIETLQQELKTVEETLTAAKVTDGEVAKKSALAEKLLAQIQNASRQFQSVIKETAAVFSALDLKQHEILNFSVNIAPIETLINSLKAQRSEILAQLNPSTEGGLELKRQTILSQIHALEGKLSERQREYQAYLQNLKTWEAERAALLGSEESPGTIKFLQKQKADLVKLPVEVKRLVFRRHRKAREILRKKYDLLRFFSSYYGDVQTFLDNHPVSARQGFKLAFNVTMAEAGFAQEFLGRINKRKLGPFMGNDEGTAALTQLIKATRWDSLPSCLKFARRLIDMMKTHQGRTLDIRDQLVGDSSVAALYNFVFSFDYLSPIYRLTWEGKGLEQLSPGERGNLLLIFYLLVDQKDIPLVIDQPEENLDNQTVFRTLVPSIKDAKKRRQIIIVTHNPNLAVVCDADQVIYSEIRKDTNNAVGYLSGSIEELVINRKILDVLEGTRPAFEKRDAKYFP